MKRKNKISDDIKIKSVQMYLKGNKSVAELSAILNVSKQSFRSWIRKYNINGAEGLKTMPKNTYYPSEVKYKAVKEYLSGNCSLYDICSKYNISSHSILQRWIIKYNNHNIISKSHNSTGDKIMIKGRKTTFDERIEIVAFCIENNNNYNLTSNKYNVSYQQVYTWVKKYNQDGSESLIDNRGKSKEFEKMSEKEKLENEIRLLKAQNKRLEIENEFLKKLEEIERRG